MAGFFGGMCKRNLIHRWPPPARELLLNTGFKARSACVRPCRAARRVRGGISESDAATTTCPPGPPCTGGDTEWRRAGAYLGDCAHTEMATARIAEQPGSPHLSPTHRGGSHGLPILRGMPRRAGRACDDVP
ncbi:hypothetical protein GCM10018966_048590 [Streptomyces yanii]